MQPHSDYSEKKRTEFVIDVQAMMTTIPASQIRSITRDMGVSDFLIRLIVNDNINYFSFKMRKDQFLSQTIKLQEERLRCKAFEHPLQKNMLRFFSDEKNLCQDQDSKK